MSDQTIPGVPGPPEEHPDLVGLLRGELTNAQAILVADHLDGCDSCRAELVDTAVGHALLSGAGRTLAPVGHADPAPLLPAPPVPPPAVRRWVRPLAAVAAVAVLTTGVAGVTWRVAQPETPPGPPVAAQTADLEPVEGQGGGQVEMVDADGTVTMTVETRDLPQVREGEFYYVWLFNPRTEKMLALGVVGPGGRADFEIPDSLVGRYQVVDVSLEADDGDPAHSVTSVLRASYAEDSTASS